LILSLGFSQNMGGLFPIFVVSCFFAKVEDLFRNIVGLFDNDVVVFFARIAVDEGSLVNGFRGVLKIK